MRASITIMGIGALLLAPEGSAQHVDTAFRWAVAPAAPAAWANSGRDAAATPTETAMQPSRTAGVRFWRTVGPATLGSYGGFVGGALVAGGAGSLRSADHSTLLAAGYVGSLLGSSALSAAGAHLLGTTGPGNTYWRSLGGAAAGMLPGFATAILVGGRGNNALVVGAGFAIGQGVTTAFVTSR